MADNTIIFSADAQKAVEELKNTLKNANLSADIKLLFDTGAKKVSLVELPAEIAKALNNINLNIGGKLPGGASGGGGAPDVTSVHAQVTNRDQQQQRQAIDSLYNTAKNAAFALGGGINKSSEDILSTIEGRLKGASPVETAILGGLKNKLQEIDKEFEAASSAAKALAESLKDASQMTDENTKELNKHTGRMRELDRQRSAVGEAVESGDGGGLVSSIIKNISMAGIVASMARATQAYYDFPVSRNRYQAAVAGTRASDIGAAMGMSFDDMTRMTDTARANAEMGRTSGFVTSIGGAVTSGALAGAGAATLIKALVKEALPGLGIALTTGGAILSGAYNYFSGKAGTAGEQGYAGAMAAEQQKLAPMRLGVEAAEKVNAMQYRAGVALGLDQDTMRGIQGDKWNTYNSVFQRMMVTNALTSEQLYGALGGMGGLGVRGGTRASQLLEWMANMGRATGVGAENMPQLVGRVMGRGGEAGIEGTSDLFNRIASMGFTSPELMSQGVGAVANMQSTSGYGFAAGTGGLSALNAARSAVGAGNPMALQLAQSFNQRFGAMQTQTGGLIGYANMGATLNMLNRAGVSPANYGLLMYSLRSATPEQLKSAEYRNWLKAMGIKDPETFATSLIKERMRQYVRVSPHTNEQDIAAIERGEITPRLQGLLTTPDLLGGGELIDTLKQTTEAYLKGDIGDAKAGKEALDEQRRRGASFTGARKEAAKSMVELTGEMASRAKFDEMYGDMTKTTTGLLGMASVFKEISESLPDATKSLKDFMEAIRKDVRESKLPTKEKIENAVIHAGNVVVDYFQGTPATPGQSQ